MKMIVLQEVSKTYSYHRYTIHALQNISFKLNAGEYLGIIGHRGSGKTTLLRCLNGSIHHDSGTLSIFEHQLAPKTPFSQRQRLFASTGTFYNHLPLVANLNMLENVMLPLRFHQWNIASRQKLVEDWMKLFELEDIAQHYQDQISPWQRTQMVLLRSIIHQPKVLVCDCAGIPHDWMPLFGQLLQKIGKILSITLVVASRNFSFLATLCHKIAVLSHGELVEKNTTSGLIESPKHPITYDYVQWSQNQERSPYVS
jgi:D-methionine transport system ATP-binding protein